MAGKRMYVQQRGRGYGSYKGPASFFVPFNQGIANRYVYFAKFEQEYVNNYYNQDLGNAFDSGKMWQDLKNIFQEAKNIQIRKEKVLLNQLKGGRDDRFATLFNIEGGKWSVNMDSNLINAYRELLTDALTSATMERELREKLNHTMFFNALRAALQKIKLEDVDFSNLNKAQEDKMTADLREMIWTNVVDQLIKSGIQINTADLMINQNLLTAFDGIGKIKSTSKNKIMKFLKSKDEFTKAIGEIKIEGLYNNISGIMDELIGFFAMSLKKEIGKGKGTITSDTVYTGANYLKSDLETTLTLPDSARLQNKLIKIKWSLKSSSLTKDSFRTPSKIAEQALLSTRYSEIENMLSSTSSLDLNLLFFHLNNQIANKLTIKDETILDILATVSIQWMFEDIINKEKKADINFYLINGKIIPPSLIFEMMSIQVNKLSQNMPRVAKASFQGLPTTIGKYYYSVENYAQVINMLKNPGTGDLSKSRHVPWGKMRDYVENNTRMGFKLNTQYIYNQLQLENLKY